MAEDEPESQQARYGDESPGEQDRELTTMSYLAVRPGLPVVTHDGDQFGVVEHVLQEPDIDLFDGIVVYTGKGLLADHAQHGHLGEALAHGQMRQVGNVLGMLRFVDADQIEAITPGYVKCLFGRSQVAELPAPAGQESYHAGMMSRATIPLTHRYGQVFSRPYWKRDRPG